MLLPYSGKFLRTINFAVFVDFTATSKMDLIPYSFAPLILFHVPYTLDLLPYIYRLQMALGV